MRKRNVSFIADKLLWFIILILPLLFALVFTCASMNNYELQVEDVNGFITKVQPSEFGNTEYFGTFLVLDGTYSFNVRCSVFNSVVGSYRFDGSSSPLIDGVDDGVYLYIEDFVLVSDGTINGVVFIDDWEDYLLFTLDNFNSLSNVSYSFNSSSFVVNQNYILSVTFDNFVVSHDVYKSMSSIINDYDYSDVIETYYANTSFGFYDNVASGNIFNTYFNNLNYSLDSWFTFGERDIVYNAFNSIFGSQSNILPIFVEGSFIPKYLTYMSWIYVLHIAFDFLVFIPRLAHKWMGGVYNDDE